MSEGLVSGGETNCRSSMRKVGIGVGRIAAKLLGMGFVEMKPEKPVVEETIFFVRGKSTVPEDQLVFPSLAPVVCETETVVL